MVRVESLRETELGLRVWVRDEGRGLIALAAATRNIGLLERLLCGEINFAEFEKQLLVLALRRNKGNQTQTANMLGMTRRTAQYRIAKFGIDPAEIREDLQS